MKNLIKKFIIKSKNFITNELLIESEKQKLLLGKMLSHQIKNIELTGGVNSLHSTEFSVFSQFGDDGIIQWLVNNLDIQNKTFVEFGVEDFSESNTRFLMMNDNWSGFVMDGNDENINSLRNSYYYWRYDLKSKAIFIDKDNINSLIMEQGFKEDVGLLHIDLDGNDYYILDQINVISPTILILEYNSLFGIDRPISVPYDEKFYRTNSHYSNLFWGASLKSLYDLAVSKGYSFIGCNSSGNNAYFIRNDKINEKIKVVDLADGFVSSKYRESRDKNGYLTYLSKSEARELLRGIEVFNTHAKQLEKF